MSTAIIITKSEKESLYSKYFTDGELFNPVLNNDGLWCLSINCVERITNTDFISLKDREYIEFTAYYESNDLSDVFNSENIDSGDINSIMNILDSENLLQRKDIRFRGLEIPEQASEVAKRLIQKGFIFLESDLPNGNPEDGQEIIEPVIREDGVMEIGQKGNPNKKVFAAMYHKDQIDIGIGQITTTPANFIEGILPNDWVGLGSEVSLDALKSELSNRGKNVL